MSGNLTVLNPENILFLSGVRPYFDKFDNAVKINDGVYDIRRKTFV